jgi:hypothetical protein
VRNEGNGNGNWCVACSQLLTPFALYSSKNRAKQTTNFGEQEIDDILGLCEKSNNLGMKVFFFQKFTSILIFWSFYSTSEVFIIIVFMIFYVRVWPIGIGTLSSETKLMIEIYGYEVDNYSKKTHSITIFNLVQEIYPNELTKQTPYGLYEFLNFQSCNPAKFFKKKTLQKTGQKRSCGD